MGDSFPSKPQAAKAILLFCLGIFFFAVNDGLGKWLVTDYPVGELMVVRAGGAALFLVPMLLRHPDALRVSDPLWLHGLRMLVLSGDTFAFYYATRKLPLADVMTFYLAAPLFITVMAVLLLGERIGFWRIAAVLLGFVGVVVALHPTGRAFSPAALVALAGSVLFAAGMIITRRLRRSHWLTLVGLQFFGSSLTGALVSGAGWVVPGTVDVILMLLVGLVSMMCFICINQALHLAQATVLAPFQYTSIVWAVLIGWLIWGDVPAPATWCGIMLIIASGVSVWLRERRAEATPTIKAAVPVV